tara:strand:- start:3367 stop:5286 length:1920 start_codon:yes stop_codon:yes gene_type:complete
MFLLFTTFIYFISFTYTEADVYLHNPRGSNNRCDRRTNDRRNANRLFNSQNNAAGGYAVPCNRPDIVNGPNNITCFQMNYYEDTIIPIRWTSQHACGENNECQYILQYACENTLGLGVRDGHPQSTIGDTCTETIPEIEEEYLNNPNKYGRHETYHYYQRCQSRSRNKGLFTATQRLRGNSGIYTRQNPNGNRYGFECPEERDYYPYWGNTPWIDIAVLTTDTNRCDYYRNNSKCHSPRFECFDNNDDRVSDIDYNECIRREGIWRMYPSWENCDFQCIQAPSSIVNRLGIANHSNIHQTFHWKLPKITNNLKNCVLRLRYNISTNETPWHLNNSFNHINSPISHNPIVNISNIPLRLAVNTAQYGRTFQDRSFTFNIIKRPTELKDKHILNINVQGKRGNIAQVRNCIEYDFVPNRLEITTDDYIHFQWVGSDFNPHNNDGEGRAGTDRSNLVELAFFNDSYPIHDHLLHYHHNNISFFQNHIKKMLASLGQPVNDNTQCFTYEQLLEYKDDDNHINNCALLNRAEPYFVMFPMKMNKTGTLYMVSTRNNNFSNRAQKLIIIIKQGNYTIQEEQEEELEIDTSKQNTANSKKYTVQIILTTIVIIIIIIGILLMKSKHGNDYFGEPIRNCIRSCKTKV